MRATAGTTEVTRPGPALAGPDAVAGLLALDLRGSLLLRHAPAAVSEASRACRPGGDAGMVPGALGAGTGVAWIVAPSDLTLR